MWSLQRLAFQQRQHILPSVAMAASAASCAVLLAEYEHETKKNNQRDIAPIEKFAPCSTTALFPWTHSNTSRCDAAFASTASSLFGEEGGNPSLQRQNAVDLLQQTARAVSKLEQTFNVNWDQPIGQGTFGTVYQGYHLETLEPVAVKTISKRFLVATDSTDSLLRELSVLLHLQRTGSGHPSICLLQQHFEEERKNNHGDEEDDVYYHLVFDLVQGGELFEQLAQHGAYSEADAARFVRQIASALVVLHGQDIVHCDLKPENLMLSSSKKDEATIKIVDFGCASMPKTTEQNNGHDSALPNIPVQQHHQGTGLTPAYCPPEVLRRTKGVDPHEALRVDASYDMWSLGVILYILLTGAHPFDLKGHSSSEEIEERILSDTELPIHKCRYTRHLSDEAKELLEALMERDPSKRLTAEQLLDKKWVQGTTASSNVISGSDKRLKEYRRHETKIGSSIFKGLISQATNHGPAVSDFAKRTSILEMAFRDLDPKNKGYLSTKELNGSTSFFARDAKLSMVEVQQLLSENMVSKHLKRGQTVYNEGDHGTAMYFLQSGAVQVSSKDGFQTTRQAGEFFGEDALLRKNGKKGQHRHSVKCLTPVHVLEISQEYFDKYLKADRDVELTMAETDRLRQRERAKVLFGLQKDLTPNVYSCGEWIFKEGMDGNLLYIMDKGSVDITVEGRKVRSLVEGEMTGEHAAFYSHKPYNVTAQCLSSTCTLQVLDGNKIRQLCEQHKDLNDAFKDIILRRDFKKAVVKATRRDFPQGDTELREVFQLLLDKDGAKGHGVQSDTVEIRFETLQQLVKQWDPQYSNADIRDMLRSLDLNNSGSLTWGEFKRIFSMFNES